MRLFLRGIAWAGVAQIVIGVVTLLHRAGLIGDLGFLRRHGEAVPAILVGLVLALFGFRLSLQRGSELE